MAEEIKRFNISVAHNGYYKVTIPNYDGGEVVDASDYDALKAENEQLKAVIAKEVDPVFASSLREQIRTELIETMSERIRELESVLQPIKNAALCLEGMKDQTRILEVTDSIGRKVALTVGQLRAAINKANGGQQS